MRIDDDDIEVTDAVRAHPDYRVWLLLAGQVCLGLGARSLQRGIQSAKNMLSACSKSNEGVKNKQGFNSRKRITVFLIVCQFQYYAKVRVPY